ncbi:MAG: BLUF domain-containing protein [Burkholderiales bacterium]|nr:BLUF domain-containing protein [Burkholderiales bacterium]
MLVRLTYASRAAAPLTQAIVADILEQSRRNNPLAGISGILCTSGVQFVQVLEGGRDPVCELYNRIVRDPRHSMVRLLGFEEITERRFGGWSMGQVDLVRVNPALLLKYGDTAEFNPFATSGRATMALLDELISAGAVITRVPQI